jgi:RNA polymerase sigma-70 factor (ECF subfamily)
MLPDQQLIQRAQGGDREAFEVLVRRHQGAVFGYFRARILQPSDAEDLTQEVFLRCYQARARFDSGSLVRPWLMGIARNLLREHARRLRRRKEVAWTELCLELDALGGDRDDLQEEVFEGLLARLPGCLESLGPSAREAIDLRYHARLRLAEIGSRLHRSEGAIKLLMFRARQTLRYCLDRKAEKSAHD